MDYRVINVSKKIYLSNKGLTPKEIFLKITSKSNELLFRNINPNDLIMICFLAGNIREGVDVERLYNQIIQNMFIFSIVEIIDDETYETCNYCGGTSEVYCDYCEGEGRVVCPECGGDGLDDDGNKCRECESSGSIDCEECRGGYVTCEECNGLGETIKYGYKTVTQEYLVSIDPKIYSILETMEPFDGNISQEFYEKILTSKNTFSVNTLSGDSDEFNSFDSGDIIFVGLEKDDVTFSFTRHGIDPDGLVSLV